MLFKTGSYLINAVPENTSENCLEYITIIVEVTCMCILNSLERVISFTGCT